MKKTSQTEVGRDKLSDNHPDLTDVINQVFALFRINFHNQYHAAFSDTQLLNQAKKLWLETLAKFPPEQILQGAKAIIEHSEYLPTLHRMIACCEEYGAPGGLPAPRDAYLEACCASSPKAAHPWSHPAIYHAGNNTGWHLLATEPETVSYPQFVKQYQQICRRAASGETLLPPESTLPEKPLVPLSKKENKHQLNKMRKALKL